MTEEHTVTDEISIAGRVHTAKEVGMHPMIDSDVEEGVHYRYFPTGVRAGAKASL